MTSQHEDGQLDGIAVIGMAGRFPGAANLEEFWRNLRDGKESVTTFTDEQLIAAGVDPSVLQDPRCVKAGVLLDGIDLFDAEFFGFPPNEAKLTDPQHRIFLECAWQALENAGYDPERTEQRVGVFAGDGMNTYLLFNLATNHELMRSWDDLQRIIASDKDYVTTRVSYKLNLKGPSITVQTACSTSLVAVHLACQSLLNGESDMVLAGGVQIRVPQITARFFEPGSINSSDGHCRAFDAGAEGTAFSSGVGIVVLKRLADAVADGDTIHAVIRSSCVNNDGTAKIGYTAPSVDGQSAVIAEAHALAGVTGDEITYVEAHGTGTPMGDPIEVAALTNAFRRTTQNKNFCAIGSLKTNIGHLGSAAGVAGLIKAVLTIENGAIPPSLNFRQPNPAIDFANSPFFVQQKLSEWKPASGKRVAGVSSFGVGGTNAHVVMEEAPSVAATKTFHPWQLLTISARTASALEKATDNLADFLAGHPNVNLGDVAFTLQNGRKVFPHRRSVAVKNVENAIQALKSRDTNGVHTSLQDQSDNPVVFMFPGQAAQQVNMGLELYKTEKRFREEVDLCCKLLKPHLGFDLKDVVYPLPEKLAEASAQLNETSVTQPAMFVIEYALAKLWMHWGVKPSAMIGHSVGEYVAACLAGVFSLEDALTLIAARGRLMQSLPRGSMLAVRIKEEDVKQYLSAELSLAVVNAKSACVVAGPEKAIAALEKSLTGQGIGCRLLHTSHAFHSPMMDPIMGSFVELFKNIKLASPRIPYLSNVTGTWIDKAQAQDPQYWAGHLRHTVRFDDGLAELMKQPQRVFLEVGPGDGLTSLARKHPARAPEVAALSSCGNGRPETSELAEVWTAVGRLWLAGARIDWRALHDGEGPRRIPLPTYPFERRRYWIDAKAPAPGSTRDAESSHRNEGAKTALFEVVSAGDSESASDRPALRTSYIAPRTDLHEALVTVWGSILGIEQIGIDDNFFELGGDSLAGTQVVSQLRRMFRVELPPNILFESRTIEKLAAYMIAHEPRPGIVEKTASALKRIESLSEEDVSRELLAKGRLVSKDHE